MKNKLTTLVAILGYLLLLTTSCDKSEEEINGGDDPVNGMDGVTVSASDPTIGYTSLELIGSIANYEDSLEASAKFVLYDGEEVVSEKTFTDLQNQEYTLEVDQLTSGKEYQFDFSVIRGDDVVTTGKKKVSTQEVKTNFAADGGFTSFRINGALEGILENTKIAIVTEVLSGETVVKTVTNEYDSDVEELEIVVPGLDMATNYTSKVTVKYGDEVLSESEEDFKTYTFSVSTKDVSNNQGGLYMEGTFTSDIDPNDDLALGFYYKKATDADDAYTWMDAEMKDETTLVAVGHGLEIGVAYDIKAAVKIVSEESEEVATEVKMLDDLHGGVFVDVAATGNNDGTSWENAFTSIIKAIENTESDIAGETNTIDMLIKKGVYEETEGINSNSSYLNIYGSFGEDLLEKVEDRDFLNNSTVYKNSNFIYLRSEDARNTKTRFINGLEMIATEDNQILAIGMGDFVINNIIFKNSNSRAIAENPEIVNAELELLIEDCTFINCKTAIYSYKRNDSFHRTVTLRNSRLEDIYDYCFWIQPSNSQTNPFTIENVLINGSNSQGIFRVDKNETSQNYNIWIKFNDFCKGEELKSIPDIITDIDDKHDLFNICE